MLSQGEKSGIQDLLQTLTSEQLKSLASTVSKGQIFCNSDAECVKAILTFEKSGEEFLHRRIISKKVVTQYAYEKNLPKVSGCNSKDDFVRVIVKYWSEPDSQVVQHSASPSTHSGPPINQASNNYNFYQINVSVDSTTVTSQIHQNSYGQQNNPGSPNNPSDYDFAHTFCNWFFSMLNHSDPISQGFGPAHFMPQAQMFTSFVSPMNESHSAYHYTNNIDISNVFLDLSKKFKFNPNISEEGMRVQSDPHGLKMILVCGTLFKDTSLFGKFQQSFGLIKDPNAIENWKIQAIALKCVEARGPVVPQFDETVLELEKVTIETLQKSLQN